MRTTADTASLDTKAELKFEVHRRVDGLIGDCRTLLGVRTEQNEWFERRQVEVGLGAGNFLITIGLMAILNFLAKVHLWLVEREAFVTKATRIDVMDAKDRIIAQFPDLKHLVKDRWLNPRLGDCNEQRAFVKFVEAIRENVNLGIASNKDAEEVWQKIRNKLTHMAMPDGGAAVLVGYSSIEEAESAIKKGNPPSFAKSETGGWVCISDILNINMSVIEIWLLQKIDECNDAESIASALEWVKAKEGA